MQALWQRFSDPQRAGAIAALAALIVVAACPLLWRGLAHQHGQLSALQAQIAEAQRATAEQPDRARRLEEAKQRLTPLTRRVGQGQSMARVLETLNARAQAHRLQIVAVQPRAAAASAARAAAGSLTLREAPLELQVSGRYRQIGEFLGSLAEAPFLAAVRTVTLSSPQESPLLEGRISLVVYLEEQT
ncbi:MAG: type 4a pilus biogenesis protein PilO [Dehalococcoidia bacterium]|nr:type 4a pilus biogenesis protein PilO [Dehalococcoidia bacterium]